MPRTLVPGAICSCQEAGRHSRHPLGYGVNGLLCTELIDTKLHTGRDTDASPSKYNLVMLAHCKCNSLMQRSSRLSSVCLSVCLSSPHQISKTKRDRHEISSPSQEIRVNKQEYNVTFCSAEKKKERKNMMARYYYRFSQHRDHLQWRLVLGYYS